MNEVGVFWLYPLPYPYIPRMQIKGNFTRTCASKPLIFCSIIWDDGLRRGERQINAPSVKAGVRVKGDGIVSVTFFGRFLKKIGTRRNRVWVRYPNHANQMLCYRFIFLIFFSLAQVMGSICLWLGLIKRISFKVISKVFMQSCLIYYVQISRRLMKLRKKLFFKVSFHIMLKNFSRQ